jgi:hypothetical protein
MVGVVEKRNLNDVVALLKMQVEGLAGHRHPATLLPGTVGVTFFDLAPSVQRLADREQAPAALAYPQMRGAEHQQAFRVPSVTRRAHSERLQCLTVR